MGSDATNDPVADVDAGHGPAWRRQRDARAMAELAASGARAEAERAQLLIDGFVAEALRRGIEPQPLRATTSNGQQVRTDRTGWYVRRNESVAVGVDGGWYVLMLPFGAGLRERLRGVHLAASQPSLVVGRGGRDGETGDLSEFLQWRLDAG